MLCIDCNPVSADRRATAPTTTFVERCTRLTKKILVLVWLFVVGLLVFDVSGPSGKSSYNDSLVQPHDCHSCNDKPALIQKKGGGAIATATTVAPYLPKDSNHFRFNRGCKLFDVDLHMTPAFLTSCMIHEPVRHYCTKKWQISANVAQT